MGRRTEQILDLRRYIYEKESHEKVLNILSEKGNGNDNYNELPLHIY